MGKRMLNLKGKKFGHLTAIEPVYKGNVVYWRCACVCGKEVTVRTGLLTSKRIRSCGCKQHEVSKPSGTFLSREREYVEGEQGDGHVRNGEHEQNS